MSFSYIIRFTNEDTAQKLLKTIKLNIKQFVITALAIYEMGPNGTCTKLVKKFPLTS